MSRRVHYIDALRVLAVLLLIPFHSARLFDMWEPFYAKNAQVSVPLSIFIATVSIWHMPLMFALAGSSSHFALSRRSGGRYLGERALRLLVPLVFGTLVVVPPQMWFGEMTNTGYVGSLIGWWPRFFTVRPDGNDYFGSFSPAHLWFIMFLFFISLVALPLMLSWRRGPDGGFAGKAARRIAEPLWWIAPILVLMISESFPDVGGKNFGRYLVFFLLGFVAMADERFTESAERWRVLELLVAIPVAVVTLLTWDAAMATPDPSWARAGHALLQNTTAWVAILACLGWGKRFLDRPSALLSYSAEASYPVYILHQTIIVAVGFYIARLSWPIAAKYPAIMIAALALTLGGYELIRRVPPLRFLFGMKPLAKAPETPTSLAA